jgi:hypothetical protein
MLTTARSPAAVPLSSAAVQPRRFIHWSIIAGAPVSNLAPLALLNAWEVRHNTDPRGT